MTALLASPYSYVQGDIIVARFITTNAIGDSEYSDPNTAGAVAQTIPSQPV